MLSELILLTVSGLFVLTSLFTVFFVGSVHMYCVSLTYTHLSVIKVLFSSFRVHYVLGHGLFIGSQSSRLFSRDLVSSPLLSLLGLVKDMKYLSLGIY